MVVESMKVRFVVFPVHGRRWSFSTSICPTEGQGGCGSALTLKELWRSIVINDQGLAGRMGLLTRFVSDKMQQQWIALEKAPIGTIRHRVHNVGQRLLARLEPSETFLKSVPKETTKVEIVFPLSLNPKLVRRRLRHVATSGAIYHRRYMYGSIALLPFTALFAVVPLPNIPLFWNLFRANAHWRALQHSIHSFGLQVQDHESSYWLGSERLLLLVSDSSNSWSKIVASDSKNAETDNDAPKGGCNTTRPSCPWVLCPCKKLESLITSEEKSVALSDLQISIICKTYNLDTSQVLKWRGQNKI